MFTLAQLDLIAGKKVDRANAGSILSALEQYGQQFGLDQPHRAVQYLAQLMHESGGFRYDKEVWGPTPAQKRYDTRTDLGNTPEADGDGKLYAGRGPVQITGKSNYEQFRDWCRKNISKNAPDFVKSPDRVNTDPWEGLGPLWYWSTRGLNRWADSGDVETITKRINGGLNGYADRVRYLVRGSLVVLGFAPDDVAGFQKTQKLEVDSDPGPRTRAALHMALVAFTAKQEQAPAVQPAPVAEEKTVAVAPAAIDKPIAETTGFWERVTSIVGSGSLAGLAWLGDVDWKVIAAVSCGLVVLSLVGLVFHARIIAAVRSLKEEAQK